MKPTIKNILKYLLSFVLAFVLLWFSFREVEWDTFISELKRCNWGYILLSMVAGSLAFWIRGLRWRQLLLPFDDSISSITTFNGINIANISNFVFPRLGEFVRCGVIVRRSEPVDAADPLKKKASYDKVLGTVVMERAWELLVMILLLGVVIVGGFDRYGPFFVDEIWGPMSQRFGAGIWAMLAGGLLLIAGAIYLIWRLRERNGFCQKVWGVFKGVGQGLASCLKMDRKWLFFAYTLLIWLLYWLMAAGTIWAVPSIEGLNLIDALFISLIGGLGFAVPVPGGIGAFHYVISLALLGVYGIPMETGVIYATLSHSSQALTQILFGAGSYVYESLQK